MRDGLATVSVILCISSLGCAGDVDDDTGPREDDASAPSQGPSPDGRTSEPEPTGDLAPAAASFNACGGDVVGLWDYESSDVQMRFVDPSINACLLDLTTHVGDVGGSVHFRDDGRLSNYTYADLIANFTVPRECLVDDGEQVDDVTCLYLEIEMGVLSTCVAATRGCDCELVVIGFGLESDGMYEAKGDELRVEDGSLPYCVSGDQLEMHKRLVTPEVEAEATLRFSLISRLSSESGAPQSF